MYFQPVTCTGCLFLCDKLLTEAFGFLKKYLQKEFEMNKLLKVTSAMTLALAALSMSANASTLDIDEAKNMTKRTKHL